MPIDPVKDTLIELDRGEQLKIEKDTDHLWRPKANSANPIADLTLEGGGRCIYYHLEDGIWYCSEYTGSLERIPEFKKKYKASEAEAREREVAKLKWEEEKGVPTGTMNASGTAAGAPGSLMTDPRNAGTASQRADYNMSMPQPGMMATASELEPGLSLPTAQDQNEPHLPSAEVTDPPAFPTPTHFPAADRGTNRMRDESPSHYSQFPAMNMPQMPLFPPSFPFGPEGHPPLPPSFPSSFPFGPGNPAPQTPSFLPPFPFGSNASAPQHPVHTPPSFPGHPSLPTGPSVAFATDSGRHNRHTVIDGATATGHGMNFNWSPDLHQERNGTYNATWSR